MAFFLKSFKITPLKKTTCTIFFILLITKTINFFIDLLVAQYFGINEYVDIYLYALMVPILTNAVLASSFNQYFIPNYLKIKEQKNLEYRQDYLLVVFVCYTVLVFLVSLFSCGILPHLLVRTNPTLFNSNILTQTYLHFSQWIGVYFFFFTISSFFISILQAEHEYNTSLYPQVLIPLIGVIFLVIFHRHWGLISIIYGFIWGAVISFFLISFKTCQKNFFSLKHKKFNFQILKTGTDFHQFLYLFSALVFPNFVSFVDKQVATYLGAGKLAALSYGQGIPNALASMLTYSLGIAVFSYFSEWVVKRQINKLIDAVRRAINFLVMLIIPFCYYVFLSSKDIIGFLFERGKFTTGETSLVSPILQYYIFLIFFQAAVIIATRVISAIHKNKFFVILYPSIFVIKLLSTTILVQYFDILGLPLSTLLIYITYFVWIYWYLHHQKIRIFNTQYSFALIKNILHLFILFVILHKAYIFIDSLSLNYFYSLLYGALLFIIIYSSLLVVLHKSTIIQKAST